MQDLLGNELKELDLVYLIGKMGNKSKVLYIEEGEYFKNHHPETVTHNHTIVKLGILTEEEAELRDKLKAEYEAYCVVNNKIKLDLEELKVGNLYITRKMKPVYFLGKGKKVFIKQETYTIENGYSKNTTKVEEDGYLFLSASKIEILTDLIKIRHKEIDCIDDMLQSLYGNIQVVTEDSVLKFIAGKSENNIGIDLQDNIILTGKTNKDTYNQYLQCSAPRDVIVNLSIIK